MMNWKEIIKIFMTITVQKDAYQNDCCQNIRGQ